MHNEEQSGRWKVSEGTEDEERVSRYLDQLWSRMLTRSHNYYEEKDKAIMKKRRDTDINSDDEMVLIKVLDDGWA